MKKKLLSFFTLAAIAIVTFAATQALRAAADDAHILWSSETPVAADWGSDAIKVTADKLEALKVGDILHVVITGVTPGTEWSAQVAIKDGGWKDLEAGVPVGKGDVTDVTFLLTGDILTAIKANGVMFSGTGYSATQVYYEEGTLTGSEKSVWIGNTTTKPTINKNHLANVKAGDVIRVSATATEGFEDEKYFLLSYSGEDTGWGWVNYEGMPATATATGFDFVVNEANVAQIKTDGIIINQAGYTITQVELLPTYEVNIGEGITGGKVSVDKVIAAEGDEVTITATPDEGYKVKSYSVTGVNTNLAVTVNNGKFKMPADAVTVSVTFNQSVDVAISPASGDISEALNAAIAELGNNDAKNITINLAENATYTISAPIVAPASVTINGNGATIDASALEGNFIQMAAIEASSAWTEANVTVKGITVKGLKKALFYSGCKQYFGDVVVDNCVVEQAGDATTFDYTKGSTAVNFTVTNSTFYAPTATTKAFYSSQGGQKTTEYNGDAKQTFTFANNTMYNLAYNKNFFSHRQSNQTWYVYNVQNNIFVNCGKSGQVIKGMNGGQNGKNPTWNIKGNVFNYGGADTSAAEDTGDTTEGENVQNSLKGYVIFKDAAKGEFDGIFALPLEATAPATMPGDPRWTIEAQTSYAITIAEGIENGTVTTTPAGYAPKGTKVAVKATPASGFATESISVMEGENKVSLDKDDNFTMPEAAVTVNATFSKAPVAITVAAEDITSGDINAAIDAKIAALAEGEKAGDITITLAADATYTLTKSIEAPASLTINGSGATIDASALESAMIVTPTGDLTRWMVGNLTIKDVTIKGLQKSLFVSAGKNYLYNDFLIENSIIEFNETAGCEFDFRKGGVAKNFTINNSTLYALSATGNSLYTSQSAQKGTDAPGVTVQTFAITNSTLYNLAKGKNFFTHRQSNQKWLAYTIKNSVFLNVGKSGQVVKGINQGQNGANPTWDIDGNIFNFEGKDTSADETTGDEAEPVKNSVAGRVVFTDATAGDFGGTFVLAPTTTTIPESMGDPRWTLATAASYTTTVGECTGGTVTVDKPYAAAGEKVYATFTPAEGYSSSDIVAIIKNDASEDVTSSITFGEDETGSYLIMPGFNITVSVVFQPLPKFYIIGDMNNWDRTAMTEMTRNEETGRYEYEYAPTTTAYFAFADKQFTEEEAAADPNWDTFNTTRYSLGEGNVDATLGEIKSLVKGVNGTIVLQPGTYKIVVEPDFNAVTITGEVTPPTPVTVDKLYIMGTGTPKGWVGTTELTFNETAQAFEYEATVTTEDTYLTFGDAEFTSWDDFNGKHRYAPGEGNTEAVLDAEVQLVLVNDGNVLLKTPGTYKISVTKDLKMTITTGGTGINGIYVDGEAADIFSDGKPVYNLSGQRVFKGYKGVVIKNGRKVVIK